MALYCFFGAGGGDLRNTTRVVLGTSGVAGMVGEN